jgi:hypothetical protein
MIKTKILLESVVEGMTLVTYKHWIDGECQCEAIKITRSFKECPTKQELLDAI